jgi:hypothetical protein
MEYISSRCACKIDIRYNQVELLLFEKRHPIRGSLCRLDFVLAFAQDCSDRLDD